MKGINKIKEKIWNEEVKKIVLYVLKPTRITIISGFILLILILGIIIVSGNFENFIVSTDIKYNSPMLKWMMLTFTITAVISLIYGISLCLYKYKRPGKKIKNSLLSIKMIRYIRKKETGAPFWEIKGEKIMKKIYNQLSLLLALILVINSCNIGSIMEVKAEDTSNLSIDKVDLDTRNAANISKDCILTSKELTVSIKTISSSEDVQTFTLYKINGEEKELVNSVKVTPEYNESEYIAQQNIKLDAKENTYSDYEYCVGVKSSSHPTEVYEDVKTSVDNADVKKIVIDTINPISENNKIKVKTWLEWSANGIESVEKVETEVKCTFRDDNSGINKIEYQVDNGEKKVYKLDGNEIHNPGENVNFADKIEKTSAHKGRMSVIRLTTFTAYLSFLAYVFPVTEEIRQLLLK